MKKDEIRRRIKAHKALLSESEREKAADSVFSILEKSAAFIMADKILMYHSLPDELSTIEFINKWHDRKHFFLPRVNGVDLEVLPYDRTSLQYGAFHIRLLSRTAATKVGVGYDFQLVDEIDAEPHDVTMDIIITESGTITIKHTKH